MSQHTIEDKVSAITNWAGEKENSWFSTDFADNMQKKLEAGETLTEGQEAGIDNIIEKMEIDVDHFKDD